MSNLTHPIKEINIGTTLATNALLENSGEKTLFITTKGFKDLLKVGYQTRPNIFETNIRNKDNLYRKVIEINERLTSKGSVLKKLNKNADQVVKN